ncbi:inorganic polyphosphate/ATP-NAD kinase, putative,poly(p)/ATP NAD kinase, putative [Trypanosoma cruzi marinkellei]|uniref:Inorganic polyphosphate/ATP-NAD kinase, putative,poly(P)/ATP NAD kinase, putative n=1 Tax=Trypanosoma cruzi marinkellei TaxID=85056 RepID=K2NN15_TRYCR|nr:inorganic polyphosphate/ATP-NAD kinase, putative,poly(p)/ATP NAD kinase, putative [Trypanosoma cruzi marinkellei]
MLRRVLPFFCYSVPQISRVGIFPLHLDPPTVQHREIFRLLVGERGFDHKNVSSSGSHAVCGGGDGQRHDNNNTNGQLAGSLWCLESLAESLKSSECVPFDHLILVPNTRFPVTLRLSTHLAALTTLVTRGLSRVHVDFTALEHPDEDMPCVYELTQKYRNSTLVHWLQDAHEMQKWAHFGDVKLRVPMLLLQTVSFPVSMVGKPRDSRFIGKYFPGGSGALLAADRASTTQQPLGQPRQEKKSEDAASVPISNVGNNDKHDDKGGSIGNRGGNFVNSPRWVNGGYGEQEVEISRSYISSSTSSWLASSDNVPLLLQPSEQAELGTVSDGENGKKDADYILRKDADPSSSVNGGHSNAGEVNGESERDMSDRGTETQPNHTVDNSGRPSSAKEMKEREGREEEIDTLTMPYDTMPARRKVRHLVEELFSTHQSMEGGQGRSSTNAPPPHVEVHTVHRCTGADVRQALWEREVDPTLLLTEPVYRYISSHGLYHDYRKDNYPKLTQVQHIGANSNTSSSSSRSSTSAWRRGKVQAIGPAAVLSFPGLIPRLELHYDRNNILAREYYEKLSVFEANADEEPDLIVPIGGDGYMMHCIRNNWDRFIPFFGVNAGHVGYLLNDPSTLGELFSAPLKLHTTIMLYCLAEKETETGEKVLLSELAFNDAWVERSSGQTALIRILVNGEERIHLLRGDGVLVSTAAGSTAYCQALGASPVPVGAPLIQIVGSNVVSPAQWRPTHLNQEDHVELEVIDSLKRPCRCFVDSVDMGNVTRMLVRSSRAAGVVIAFTSSCDLQQKLYQMQFPNNM